MDVKVLLDKQKSLAANMPLDRGLPRIIRRLRYFLTTRYLRRSTTCSGVCAQPMAEASTSLSG